MWGRVKLLFWLIGLAAVVLFVGFALFGRPVYGSQEEFLDLGQG